MTRELTQTEVAYLAGIFDGEGCISIMRRHCYRPRLGRVVKDYSIHVRVGNTSAQLLDWIAERVGGAIYSQKVVGNRQKAWHWHLGKRDAAEYLRLIRPYVIVKTRQIDLALKFIGLGRDIVPTVRAEMYEQMRELNSRGAGKGTAEGAASVTKNPREV